MWSLSRSLSDSTIQRVCNDRHPDWIDQRKVNKKYRKDAVQSTAKKTEPETHQKEPEIVPDKPKKAKNRRTKKVVNKKSLVIHVPKGISAKHVRRYIKKGIANNEMISALPISKGTFIHRDIKESVVHERYAENTHHSHEA